MAVAMGGHHGGGSDGRRLEQWWRGWWLCVDCRSVTHSLQDAVLIQNGTEVLTRQRFLSRGVQRLEVNVAVLDLFDRDLLTNLKAAGFRDEMTSLRRWLGGKVDRMARDFKGEVDAVRGSPIMMFSFGPRSGWSSWGGRWSHWQGWWRHAGCVGCFGVRRRRCDGCRCGGRWSRGQRRCDGCRRRGRWSQGQRRCDGSQGQ